MKTARGIEEQEARKADEEKGVSVSDNRESVSEKRRRSLANLKPCVKGVSGNPGGKPKHDIAAEIAKAIFENDAEAIYAAFAKMLRKASPYAFQVLSDRAFGKMKETHHVDISPYKDVSTENLEQEIKRLEVQLSYRKAEEVVPVLPRRANRNRISSGRWDSVSAALLKRHAFQQLARRCNQNVANLRGFPMYCLTVNLTSSEWVRIKNCAAKQWPQECLSYAEIVRRYVLAGIESLKNVSPTDQARLAHQFQASMTVADTRLKS